MKIQDAKKAYAAQMDTLWTRKRDLSQALKNCQQGGAPNVDRVEISRELSAVDAQYNEAQGVMESIIERETAIHNAEVAKQQEQGPVLLHLRRAGGLPGPGEGSGRDHPRPHRAAADRRAGRGPDAGRPGHLRPALLLRPVFGRVPARVHQNGQDAEPVIEPHQNFRGLRAADVLPEV